MGGREEQEAALRREKRGMIGLIWGDENLEGGEGWIGFIRDDKP